MIDVTSLDAPVSRFSPRTRGDIQTAVIALIDRLVPLTPVSRQPAIARDIAEVLASKSSAMNNSMFLRQSIIRRNVADHQQTVDGLAAWVMTLFDLGNLRYDRSKALDIEKVISTDDVERLRKALAASSNGCILAVPHAGSLELLAAYLVDQGFDTSFVQKISAEPTQAEHWIYDGRGATGGRPISFGHRNVAGEVDGALGKGGVVILVADVYPSSTHEGIEVDAFGGRLSYPPGPAWYAETGTLVLPAFVTARDARGISMRILDPINFPAQASTASASADFTQSLATAISDLTADHPDSFWLWHPIPHDPFLAFAHRQRPDLLREAATLADDEEIALAVEAMDRAMIASALAG